MTGIDWSEGTAKACVVSASGLVATVGPAELASRGLPNLSTTSPYARRVTTDLCKWKPAPLEEYATAFGINACGRDAGHAAWEFSDGRTRFVVPALALLRALVRPERVLLPSLFKAQSLDDICLFKGGPGIPIEPLGTLGDGRRKLRIELLSLLSWFFCFPSARQLWASIYQHSKYGTLDMTLPRATFAFNVRSLHRVRDCYVTSLSAIDVEANEEPFEFASAHPRVMHLSARERAGAAAHSQRLVPQLRPRSFTPVTEAEWAEIAPLLESRKGAKADDSLMVLNAIMWKQSEGARWHEVFSRYGNNVARAPTSLSRWKADGRWDAALGRLDELRSGDTGIC